MRQNSCERGTLEVPFQHEDEEIIQDDIDRRGNEENEQAGVEEPLSLREAFSSFEDGVSGSACKQDRQVASSKVSQLFLRYQSRKDPAR